MTDLPRYSTRQIVLDHSGVQPFTAFADIGPRTLGHNPSWVKASDHDAYVADVSARLQQLEQEKARLQKAALRVMNCDCLICCACSGELEAATGEKATDDFDWRPVERSKWEITYSKEVEERIAKSEAALAETRDTLHQLVESEAFYDAMQAYRHGPITEPGIAFEAFEHVKALILAPVKDQAP